MFPPILLLPCPPNFSAGGLGRYARVNDTSLRPLAPAIVRARSFACPSRRHSQSSYLTGQSDYSVHYAYGSFGLQRSTVCQLRHLAASAIGRPF